MASKGFSSGKLGVMAGTQIMSMSGTGLGAVLRSVPSFIPGRAAVRPAGVRCPSGSTPIIKNGVTVGCIA